MIFTAMHNPMRVTPLLYRSKLGDRDTFTSPGLAVTLLSFKSMMIEVQRPLLARIERR